MNRILKRVLAGGLVWLARNYQKVSIDMAKIEAATAYVKTIKNVRMVVMAIIGLLTITSLLVVSLFCTIIGIVWILPVTMFAKGVIFLSCSALLFLTSLIVILVVISQKRWMHKSKADQFVREATMHVLHRRQHA